MKGQVLVYRRLKPIKEKLSCAVGGVGDSGIQRKPGTLASAGISDQSYDNSMRLSNYTVDDVDTIRQLVLSRPGRRREFSDSIDREVCPAVHQSVGILRARQRGERVSRVALPRCHQYGGAGSGD